MKTIQTPSARPAQTQSTRPDARPEASSSDGLRLWLVLLRTYFSMAGRLGASIRAAGLGDSDFRVLEALLHKGPLPVNVIGPKVFLTAGSISTAVERLHQRGLVDRSDSAADRRLRVVELTPAGRKLITRVFAQHAAEVEQLTSVLSGKERRKLTEALRALGKNAAENANPRTPRS